MAHTFGHVIGARLKKFTDRISDRILGVPEPVDVVSNNPQVLASQRARQTLPQTLETIRQAHQARANIPPIQPVKGSSIPRFDIEPGLSQGIRNPVGRVATRFLGEIPNAAINIIPDMFAGSQQAVRNAGDFGFAFGQRAQGQQADVVTPLQNTLTGSSRFGLGAFNLLTLGRGGPALKAAGGLTRVPFRQALRQGARTGARFGATEGALYGGIAGPNDTLGDQALNTAAGFGFGLVGGTALGAGAAAVPSAIGAPFRAANRAFQRFRTQPASQLTREARQRGGFTLRGQGGRLAGSERSQPRALSVQELRTIASPAQREKLARTAMQQLVDAGARRHEVTRFAGNIFRGAGKDWPQARDRLIRYGQNLITKGIRSGQRKPQFHSAPGEFFAAGIGIDPERDEQGNLVGIGFDPERAALGVGLAAGTTRGRKVAADTLNRLARRHGRKFVDAFQRAVGGVDNQEGFAQMLLRAGRQEAREALAKLSRRQRPQPSGQTTAAPSHQASGAFRSPLSPIAERAQRLGEKAQSLLAREPSQKAAQAAGGKSLPETVTHNAELSVKSKVGLHDFLRTPDRVMQKIGLGKEMDFIRQQYNKYVQELPVELQRVRVWAEQVPGQDASRRIFNYLDGQNVQLAPQEQQVAGEIQVYLRQWADRLGLPEDQRIAHYITHIFEPDFIQKEFDPDLARIIRDKVPGSVYDPFLEQRLGKQGYVEDVWRALDAYVKRATRKANMDPALAATKKAAEGLEESQFNYVKQFTDRINMRPTQLDNLIDNTVKQAIGYKFGARPVARVVRRVRNWVYRGTLGLNVGSAVRNLTQGVNTYAKLKEKYTIIGYTKLIKRLVTNDLDELKQVGVLQDNIIQDRRLSAIKSTMERVDKGLWALFDLAEKINRGAAYYGAKAQALARGASEQDAVAAGLKMVRDTQFTFGSIDTPPVLQNDIARFFLQFQSFNIKQLEFLTEMVRNKELGGIVRFIGANTMLVGTVGAALGYDLEDIIPFSGVATGRTKLGHTPPVSFGLGLVRSSLGLPDKFGNEPEGNIFRRITGNQDVQRSAVAFVPGGVQLKKTATGFLAGQRGFSESRAGRARFPLGQSVPERVQAAIFGEFNNKIAQYYFDNDLTPLGDKDTKSLQQRIGAGEGPKEAYYSLFTQQMARSKRAPEEKQRLLDEMRTILGIEEASAAGPGLDTAAQFSDVKARRDTYTKVKELLNSDLKAEAIQTQARELGVSSLAGDAGAVGTLMFWRDQVSGEFESIDIGELVAREKPRSVTEQIKHDKDTFQTVGRIMDSGLPDEAVNSALQQLGVPEEDADYYQVAKQDSDTRAVAVEELLSGVPNDQRLAVLEPLVRRVGEKAILTNGSNGLINQLYKLGVISEAEKKHLNSLEYDRKSGTLRRVRGSGKKAKKFSLSAGGTVPSASVPAFKRGGQTKATAVKPVKIKFVAGRQAQPPGAGRVPSIAQFRQQLEGGQSQSQPRQRAAARPMPQPRFARITATSIGRR